MSKIVPVSFENHGKKRLLPLKSYQFARKEGLIPITAGELPVAAHCYPIVFMKPKDKAALFVLLGFERGENLFVDENGRWLGDYVPAALRRYPFIFGKAQENAKELVLCVDEQSGLLADAGGEPLFTEGGEKAPALEKILSLTSEYHKSALAAEAFCRAMEDRDLLVPHEVKVRTGEKTGIKLDGLFRVDEKRVNDLNDADFLDLRSKGHLPMIYLHLFSLPKAQELATRKMGKAKAGKIPEGNLFKF